MSSRTHLRRLAAAAAVISVAAIACGCNFFTAADPTPTRSVTAADARASVLVVEVDTAESGTIALLIPLLEETARPYERLAVTGTGRSTISSIAPGPVSVPAPSPPLPLSSSATAYQRAEHQHEVGAYRKGVRRPGNGRNGRPGCA